jgi:enoyl-CoA hydratase/carnithine racemase
MYMKRQVYRHLNVSLGEAFIETNDLQEETVALPDFTEGIASFMERRPPNFPRITVD